MDQNFKLTILLFLCALKSTPAYSHSYPKLTHVSNAQSYINAIVDDSLYSIDVKSSDILRNYYVDMTFKNKFLDKDIILRDFVFYSGLSSFSGEVCSLIWRNLKNKNSKYRVNSEENENVETTPFFDYRSQWYSERYSIKYRGDNVYYDIFLSPGKEYSGKSIGYPVHRVGDIFISSSNIRNHLVISVQTKFIAINNGVIDNNYLLNHNLALLTMIYIPFSYESIGKIQSEKKAHLYCKLKSKIVVPK
ncbi:hypothetical protein [Vibrio sp. Vb1980]|uniref:hypothetical protein n=1 Tax=Vibrio sp. Vb1980 TaxID=3074646 RepID=UPI0029652FE6|nr:hypothetical protein [Vibrio sp. Vb1980]MDW1977409.1 hypothetical protein [Vibrio sp. Vb1980]